MSAGTFIQASLAGGEIGPGLYGRVDLARYQTALKLCRNFIPRATGGCINRAGFRFVGEVKNSAKFTRLMPFIYNGGQAYIMELGEQYARVYAGGGQVQFSAPAAWATATVYTASQLVSQGGTNYYCRTPHTSGTWSTDLADGKWYALTGTTVEFPTPWFEGDLPLLKVTQSADVLTLCHPDYLPEQVTRQTSDASRWTCSDFAYEFGPFKDINEDTAQMVYASAVSGNITITSAGFTFGAADVGKLIFVGQQDFGQAWESGKSIALNDIRRVGGNYYLATNAGTSGTSIPQNIQDKWNDGAVTWQFLHPGFGIAKITAFPVPVTAAAYAGGTTYAKYDECSYGGKTYQSLQVANTGHQPDTSPTWWQDMTNLRVQATVLSRIPDAHIAAGKTTYKWALCPWNEAEGYPTATTYHQQRAFFGGSPKAPQTVWGSRVGDFTNFGVSTPILDADAVTYPLAGRQVNQVKHLISLGAALIAFTSDSYWTLVGDGGGGSLTPSAVQANVQSYFGSSDVAPVTVGNQLLFATDKGKSVRNVGYDYTSLSYTGDDLTQLANHLFEGHRIVDMAYQQTPFGVLWCVREDGLLISLTFNKDQQVTAWARHDTDGAFESVAVIPEASQDALYAIVRRTINGQVRRYIERMEDRYFSDQRDAFFVDSGLSFDGTNRTATTVTLSGGTTWDESDAVVVSSSADVFAYPDQGDQGDAIVFTTTAGKRLALKILSTSSTTSARAVPNREVPTELRNVATTAWAWGRTDFSGLSHLEGKTVNILTDANVHPQRTVVGGQISVQTPAVHVHAGLPLTSDLITLDLAVFNGETIRDKRKLVDAVRLQVKDTRGLRGGIPGKTMIELKQRSAEDYSQPVSLKTGLATLRIVGTWNNEGSVQISQNYPLPAEVLSIMPEVSLGGN